MTGERPTTAGQARVLVASNRGPVAFTADAAGRLALRRGGGGLVSGTLSVAQDGGLVWVCAALSDPDRRAAGQAPAGRLDRAGHDTGGAAVRMLDIDRVVLDRAYNAVANRTLWFVLHLLYSTSSAPTFGPVFRREWEAYEHYNGAFAAALAEEASAGATVVIQDYHLTLTPRQLRALRPDLRIAHFSHTPWVSPEYYRLLPDYVARAVLAGMLGADLVGFLTREWAEAFLACCAAVLGARVSRWGVTYAGRTTRIGVHPLGVDGPQLRERAARKDAAVRTAELAELAGARRLLVRVDRTELSKNIVRGLQAYRELLRTRPEWRERVLHLVCAYPSRHDLPEYREYTAAVQRIAEDIREEFATDGWDPVRLDVSDDYPRSLAALSLAQVLVVNPIRDGMNLVAKEGPVLAMDGVALVLSREAGACAELGSAALVVNPYDVTETAEAMHAGLSMPPAERRSRTERLVAAATALPPQTWFRELLGAVRG
ncbi:MAG TPA: trehalose-6-phosphate synthase [Frankiaceae bacterium]|nr:trehalose-6-phosphate synthase [Frankiaceae bacterium]